MNGYRVILGPDNKPRKLEPSPYNGIIFFNWQQYTILKLSLAFKSRPRPLENYEISHHGDTQADSDSDDSDTDSSADNASDASDMDNAKDKRVFIFLTFRLLQVLTVDPSTKYAFRGLE
jgi:hypothetical protein